ncbi:hypothetical protein BH09SUM1_BH09SUM1_33800 [soil metagenome]
MFTRPFVRFLSLFTLAISSIGRAATTVESADTILGRISEMDTKVIKTDYQITYEMFYSPQDARVSNFVRNENDATFDFADSSSLVNGIHPVDHRSGVIVNENGVELIRTSATDNHILYCHNSDQLLLSDDGAGARQGYLHHDGKDYCWTATSQGRIVPRSGRPTLVTAAAPLIPHTYALNYCQFSKWDDSATTLQTIGNIRFRVKADAKGRSEFTSEEIDTANGIDRMLRAARFYASNGRKQTTEYTGSVEVSGLVFPSEVIFEQVGDRGVLHARQTLTNIHYSESSQSEFQSLLEETLERSTSSLSN